MIVYVYKSHYDGEFLYFDHKLSEHQTSLIFLGTQEQPDIQPEKKTVVKEVPPFYISGLPIPPNAKNVKLTYEVEE